MKRLAPSWRARTLGLQRSAMYQPDGIPDSSASSMEPWIRMSEAAGTDGAAAAVGDGAGAAGVSGFGVTAGAGGGADDVAFCAGMCCEYQIPNPISNAAATVPIPAQRSGAGTP